MSFPNHHNLSNELNLIWLCNFFKLRIDSTSYYCSPLSIIGFGIGIFFSLNSFS